MFIVHPSFFFKVPFQLCLTKFSLEFIYFLFMCGSALAILYVCMHTWCRLKPEKGVRSSGNEITCGCESLCGCGEPNLGPLGDQLVLLTVESLICTHFFSTYRFFTEPEFECFVRLYMLPDFSSELCPVTSIL